MTFEAWAQNVGETALPKPSNYFCLVHDPSKRKCPLTHSVMNVLRDTGTTVVYAFEIGAIHDSRSDAFRDLRDLYLDTIFPNQDVCIEECPMAVAMSILHSLSLLEFARGAQFAEQEYSIAKKLFGDASQQQREWWYYWEDHYYAIDNLMLQNRHHCGGFDLRFYMYPMSEEFARTRLYGGRGMLAAANHITNYFKAGSCLTTDPDAADFFIIPTYHGDQRHWVHELSSIPNEQTERRSRSETYQFWGRNQGADHIALIPANLPDQTETGRIRNSIFLSVEAYKASDNKCAHGLASSVTSWKDIIIPGYIDEQRMLYMSLQNKPTHERGYLLIFHGGHSGSDRGAEYRRLNNTMRERLINELRDLRTPFVSVGAHVADFFERMGRAHFCMIPKGSSSWTIHLTESFFFGCIPIILSDNMDPPFQNLIDWSAFAMKLPMNVHGTELYHRLNAIPKERIKVMRDKMLEHTCWFNYTRGFKPELDLEWFHADITKNQCPQLEIVLQPTNTTLQTCLDMCRDHVELKGICNAMRRTRDGCEFFRCEDVRDASVLPFQRARHFHEWVLRPCSPYDAILQELRERKRRMPRFSRWWGEHHLYQI